MAEVLTFVNQPGIELAAWSRDRDPLWVHWLDSLSPDALPACRLELAPADAAAWLDGRFDACVTPRGQARAALIMEMARLVDLFARLARAPGVRLRLDMVTDNACRRWHRDCVPQRLICTYRGPGTQRVRPADGAQVLSRPDDDAPRAISFRAEDVAVFKGCGAPGQTCDGCIVHCSPRVDGTGHVRLVLVLDTG
ncbi:DUF1826 domain-containing protein [Azohydromonas sediminis]|uniref:DUF1826 domain-containing protein n=1 Tax=Azohydromonas sediminis TaxID=2259674 RepID=UPI0013C34369|nr:DUF1826 domain-containing protein [Azohydromonas sediminis]